MFDPSAGAAASLTGLWHGRYSYPIVLRAPVPFSASLIEAEDFLGGSITERAMVGPVRGRTLYATVGGRRAGSAVSFVKSYEAKSGPYTRVAYEGVVSGDGLEIDGEWTTGGWSGRFLMIRAGGMVKQAIKQISVKV